MNHETHSKVQPRHLKKNAYLYVRQSSLRQVFENSESTKRQYDLKQRALALGWSASPGVDLANRTHVIRQMGNAADYAAQLDALDLSWRAQNHQPPRSLVAELNAKRLPLRSCNAGFLPAGCPVGVGEGILTLAPAVHERQSIAKVRHVRGD